MFFKLFAFLNDDDETVDWRDEISDFVKFVVQSFWGFGWASTAISVLYFIFVVLITATDIKNYPYILATPLVAMILWAVFVAAGTIFALAVKLLTSIEDDGIQLFDGYYNGDGDFKSFEEEIAFGKKWCPANVYFLFPIRKIWEAITSN